MAINLHHGKDDVLFKTEMVSTNFSLKSIWFNADSVSWIEMF